MLEPIDRQLLAGLKSGVESAYAELYDRFTPRLFRTARLLTGSDAAAEDVIQDVFVGVFQARRNLNGVENLCAYLFSSLRHATTKRANKKPIVTWYDQTSALVMEKTTTCADSHEDRLERALKSLPDDQRDAVLLKIDGDLTFEELGNILGVSANTAASRYRYALAKLREHFEDKNRGR